MPFMDFPVRDKVTFCPYITEEPLVTAPWDHRLPRHFETLKMT